MINIGVCRQSTNGKDKDDVINDPILSRALIRSLEIIGEASNKTKSWKK
ncbi:ribonuclease HepT family protein [Pedobacter hartonius]|uniref:Uncharacterized protein n=1 Tax=Pedobacter hartonius TaxID=425514 RepID=A0A1H4ASE7_9SPHI|nr:hypothetical protein [Pedobacter hartonius]SEA38865.1 hypothetical protein SAMN05443550_10380 [Pedobacter hartonius]